MSFSPGISFSLGQNEFLNDFQHKHGRRKFTFLLIGRTGVGKSSTINSLMGKEVSEVGHFRATTKIVKSHKTEIEGIPFIVIDTPGLTENESTDINYLVDIQQKITQIDCLWFVTSLLRETRFEFSEKETVRLISEKFGRGVWKWSILVFTFADGVRQEEYKERLETWTRYLRQEIAIHTENHIAERIPAIAVANGENEPLLTPDGETWLDKLYTQVFLRITDTAAVPFSLVTRSQVSYGTLDVSSTGRPSIQHDNTLFQVFEKIVSSNPLAMDELTKNFEQARQQAKSWHRLSLIAATTGFILLGVGIVTLVFGQLQIGAITSLSGILPNVADIMVSLNSKRKWKKQSEWYKEEDANIKINDFFYGSEQDKSKVLLHDLKITFYLLDKYFNQKHSGDLSKLRDKAHNISLSHIIERLRRLMVSSLRRPLEEKTSIIAKRIKELLKREEIWNITIIRAIESVADREDFSIRFSWISKSDYALSFFGEIAKFMINKLEKDEEIPGWKYIDSSKKFGDSNDEMSYIIQAEVFAENYVITVIQILGYLLYREASITRPRNIEFSDANKRLKESESFKLQQILSLEGPYRARNSIELILKTIYVY